MKRIIVITTYPRKYHTNAGVATATKKLLDSWSSKYPNDHIDVFAEKYDKTEQLIYNNQFVYRVWAPDSIQSWRHLEAQVRKIKPHKLIWQLELNLYGNPTSTLALLMRIRGLKKAGYNVVTVVHQVVTDISSLSGHIGIKADTPKARIYNEQFLPRFYRLVASASNRIVVFEEVLKQRLHKLGIENVVVIPHGVDKEYEKVSSKAARQHFELDTKPLVVGMFGFIAWYKGHHILLKTAKKLQNTSIRFLIGGGESPTQRENDTYQKYYHRILDESRDLENVDITGYLREDEIGEFFAACDVVVFPYRTVMSSSGPFALTLAHERPLMLSEQMYDGIKDTVSGVSLNNQIFSTSGNLATKLQALETDTNQLQNMAQVSSQLKEMRLWENLVDRYRDL